MLLYKTLSYLFLVETLTHIDAHPQRDHNSTGIGMDYKFQCEYVHLFNMSLCIAHSAVKTPAGVLKSLVRLKHLTSLQFFRNNHSCFKTISMNQRSIQPEQTGLIRSA